MGILDFGEFGFWILGPESQIQNPKSPISKLFWPNFGDFGFWILDRYVAILYVRPQRPIFWILAGILNFGFWKLGIEDFGFWGFWILDFGDFGFWGFWILDCGDFGFWLLGFWILAFGILDFGFWGFWILDFGILGRSRGCTTRQFGDGAWRSEARIPPGLPLGATSKPTVSDRVGARKQIEHFFRGQNPTKSPKNPDFQPTSKQI